jgi:hypothetical protein
MLHELPAMCYSAASRLPYPRGLGIGAVHAVQFADAAQTVYGISRFGPAIEANPILSMCIAAFGAGTALFGAKMVAVIGGAALHVCSYHFVLVVLTVAYVFGAVVPWALVLGP